MRVAHTAFGRGTGMRLARRERRLPRNVRFRKRLKQGIVTQKCYFSIFTLALSVDGLHD